MFVIQNNVVTRNNPGISIIHHDPESKLFYDKESILPHEIISSSKPIPIKLSVDSETIALRIFIATINIINDYVK